MRVAWVLYLATYTTTTTITTAASVSISLFGDSQLSSEAFSENNKCCTDCKTTKTPLWRGGPAGPKTLCNACGIRYRKKRVSMVELNKGQERKRERARSRGGKAVGDGGNDLRESLKIELMALGEEVLLQRSPSVVKKQRRLGEEEQAAVCLMALSCGFVFA